MIVADSSKKSMVEDNKIQKLKRSAIFEGDLGEH